jgi:DNA-binding CsgD family transcriptional regulator
MATSQPATRGKRPRRTPGHAGDFLDLHQALDLDTLWRAVVRVVSESLPGCEIIAALPLEGLIPVTFRTTLKVDDPATYWQRVNAAEPPMAEVIARSPGFEITFLDDDMSPESIEGRRFYHEIMAPSDIRHMCGLLFWEDQHFFSHIGLARSAALGPFTDEERRLIRDMHPHFAAALVRVKSIDRLKFVARLLSESLEHPSDGLILVDFRQTVIFHNRAAEQACRLWRNGPEAAARNRQRGDVFRLPEDIQAAVATLIQRFLEPSQLPGAAAKFENQLPHPVLPGLAARIRVDSPRNHAATPYLRIELSRVTADQEAVPVFKLSEAEHRVALLVAKGMSNDAAATLLSLSVNTVRAHLRQIFEKLGIQHRGQLAGKFSATATPQSPG